MELTKEIVDTLKIDGYITSTLDSAEIAEHYGTLENLKEEGQQRGMFSSTLPLEYFQELVKENKD